MLQGCWACGQGWAATSSNVGGVGVQFAPEIHLSGAQPPPCWPALRLGSPGAHCLGIQELDPRLGLQLRRVPKMLKWSAGCPHPGNGTQILSGALICTHRGHCLHLTSMRVREPRNGIGRAAKRHRVSCCLVHPPGRSGRSSWLWTGSALAFAATWGVNQMKEDLSVSPFWKSAFAIKQSTFFKSPENSLIPLFVC